MINIATSICVDTSAEDNKSIYPNIGSLSKKAKREVYWKLVTTFCCSSIRCNSQAKHYVYTNDTNKIVINRIDIKAFLEKLGVTIIYLPFKRFIPPEEHCTTFKNAFYKLDVIADLSKRTESHFILLDSDCLWVRHSKDFIKKVASEDRLFLLDFSKRKDSSSPALENIASADLLTKFQKIDSTYPCLEPVWYGGELIAGKGKNLKIITDELSLLFNRVADENWDRQSLTFDNGKNMFDGMELSTSYVYNKYKSDIYNCKKYIKRIWTLSVYNNVSESDLNIPVWHLPGEKKTGLNLLFYKATDPKSKFWKISSEDFPLYLGRYVGIPARKISFIEQKRLDTSTSYWRNKSRLEKTASKVRKSLSNIFSYT